MCAATFNCSSISIKPTSAKYNRIVTITVAGANENSKNTQITLTYFTIVQLKTFFVRIKKYVLPLMIGCVLSGWPLRRRISLYSLACGVTRGRRTPVIRGNMSPRFNSTSSRQLIQSSLLAGWLTAELASTLSDGGEKLWTQTEYNVFSSCDKLTGNTLICLELKAAGLIGSRSPALSSVAAVHSVTEEETPWQSWWCK